MLAVNRFARYLGTIALALSVASVGGAQTPKIGTEELLARLTKLTDSLAARGALSGVILVTKDGQPIFEHAYGFADREARRANTVGSSFNLSSIGKRFTQVAVAQLAAAGKLHLDSTIASVWPDYPNREVARIVTIRELLEHRSGIGGDIFQRFSTLRSNAAYIPLFVNDPLHFTPGTREEYSNAGYVVLGEIVARASGESYYEYVQKHIFDPAGMTSSGYFSRDSLPPFASVGYTRQREGVAEAAAAAPLMPAESIQPSRGSAAGGAYSSAGDLLKFIRSSRAGTFGLPIDAQRSIVAGGSPGSNGVVAEGLPGGYDLIVLENLDPPAADAIVQPVTTWLGAAGPGPARRIVGGGNGAGAAATLPDSPVGRIAAHFLRAYNSGEPDSVRRFYDAEAVSDSTRPTSLRVERYKTIYAENGRLELATVDEATPTSLTVTVNASRGGTMSMTFTVERAEPYRLASLQLNISR